MLLNICIHRNKIYRTSIQQLLWSFIAAVTCGATMCSDVAAQEFGFYSSYSADWEQVRHPPLPPGAINPPAPIPQPGSYDNFQASPGASLNVEDRLPDMPLTNEIFGTFNGSAQLAQGTVKLNSSSFLDTVNYDSANEDLFWEEMEITTSAGFYLTDTLTFDYASDGFVEIAIGVFGDIQQDLSFEGGEGNIEVETRYYAAVGREEFDNLPQVLGVDQNGDEVIGTIGTFSQEIEDSMENSLIGIDPKVKSETRSISEMISEPIAFDPDHPTLGVSILFQVDTLIRTGTYDGDRLIADLTNDFGNTAHLMVNLYDMDMNPVDSFNVTSAHGIQYQTSVNAVPEPNAGFVLTAFYLTAFSARRRKTRR